MDDFLFVLIFLISNPALDWWGMLKASGFVTLGIEILLLIISVSIFAWAYTSIPRRNVMPKFPNYDICSAGWDLYLRYCDLADARGKKKEAREAWKTYTKHRNHCKECTPIKVHKPIEEI